MPRQMVDLGSFGPVGARHLGHLMRHFALCAHPFIGHQKHTLREVERGEFRVHRNRDDGIGLRDILILKPGPLWAEKHRNPLARRDLFRGQPHRRFGAVDRLGQVAAARGGGKGEIAIAERARQIVAMLRLIQQPPRARGHGHGRLTRPAVTRSDDPHVIKAKVPHRARRGADVLAHLWADKHDGRDRRRLDGGG